MRNNRLANAENYLQTHKSMFAEGQFIGTFQVPRCHDAVYVVLVTAGNAAPPSPSPRYALQLTRYRETFVRFQAPRPHALRWTLPPPGSVAIILPLSESQLVAQSFRRHRYLDSLPKFLGGDALSGCRSH